MARRAIDNRDELGPALIVAAEEMIRSGGVESLKARALAQKLAVSVGTVYNVHGSMDELVEKVNARTLARLQAEVAKIEIGKGSVAEVLEEFAVRYMDYVRDNRNLWELLFEGKLAESAQANQVRIDRLFGFLEKALEPVAPDPEVRAKSARVLWASVHGLTQMAFTGRLQVLKIDDVQAIVRHAIACHLAGLEAQAR
jgi:AcrR family transcriptional regulator